MAIAASESIDTLYLESLIKGDQWIEENKLYFSKFNIPYNLIRWNRWLNDPKFQDNKRKILYMFKHDDAFKTNMNITINEFFTRLNKRENHKNLDYDEIYKHCYHYLIEECTVQLLWAEHPYHFEIYPNERNPILSYCHKKIIEPLNPILLRPVALKFKKVQAGIVCN